MTARVNLLPGTVRERDAATKQRVYAGLIVLIVLAGLAGATLWQRGVLNDAEDELADAEAELAAAQQEVAELAEFADLEERLARADDLLSTTMSEEATLAGVLQDVALVIPSEGAFTAMTINLSGADGANVGNFTASAEVLSSHAPGVERFLLQLERAAGFRSVYPGGSTIDEDDIASFNVSVQLGPEYLTQRYDDGLPEVIR